MKNTKLLSIENLSISLKQGKKITPVVCDLTLSVNRGETVAVVGSSGSGKTLAALSILQLLPHVAHISKDSRIFLEDTDLLLQTHMQMRKIRGKRIGMIFQEASTALNPVMTIREQIELVLKCHTVLNKKSRYARILSLLEQVGISDPVRAANAYPHMLSGGMRQRAMIAMALAPEPDLLIADEPTTALDVTLQAQILKLLADIQQKQGIGLLFITHDLAIAKQIAHRIAIMSNGKLLECEPTQQFFERQLHPYSQALLNALPSWEKRENAPNIHQAGENKLLSVEKLNINYVLKKGLLGYGRQVLSAVNDVSFTIDTGQTFALVGESGSGKTTLAKAILNLVRPNTGKIWFEGGESARKGIQVIFQDPAMSMNPRMRVGQILSEGVKAQKIFKNKQDREKKVAEMLVQVGLSEDCLERYPHEFSGGQRQRICIARALLMQPKLLICDEPTSALDVITQMEILRLLQSLQQNFGISYLLITHNLSVVSYLADKVAVMHRGRIVEQGDVAEILFNPQDAYTKTLLAALPA